MATGLNSGPHEVDWSAARQALRHEVSRVTSLLREVRDPHAPAVGEWNLSEVAMHLSQAWAVVLGLSRGDLAEARQVVPSLASQGGEFLIDDLWELSSVTTAGVGSDPERDLAVLADRIEARAAEYLAYCEDRSADEDRSWLVEGVTVGLPVLTGHLLSETIAHGYDIATADGRSWSIDLAHAAMVLDGFIIPIVAAIEPHTMVQERAATVQVCYDLRIRGGGRHFLVFDSGTLTVERPSARPVDCHLSVDPVAFLLLSWNRIGQWGPIARGKLMAWGRRPWWGLRLRSMIRTP